jgi:hypothetical protein
VHFKQGGEMGLVGCRYAPKPMRCCQNAINTESSIEPFIPIDVYPNTNIAPDPTVSDRIRSVAGMVQSHGKKSK